MRNLERTAPPAALPRTAPLLAVIAVTSLLLAAAAQPPGGSEIVGGPVPEPFLLLGHSHEDITGLTWQPGGSDLASTGKDAVVNVWNTVDGTVRHSVPFQSKGIPALAWSPDGALLAQADEDKRLRVRKPENAQALVEQRFSEELQSLAWGSGGMMAVGGKGGTLWFCERSGDGRLAITAERRAHTATVRSAAWRPDGRLLASGGDRRVRFWSGPSWNSTAAYEFPADILTLAWNPAGSLLACGDADGSIFILAPPSPVPLFSFKAHRGPIRGLAWPERGQYLASGSADGTVRIWQTNWQQRPEPFREMDCFGGVMALAWSEENRTLAASGGDRRLHLWGTDWVQRRALGSAAAAIRSLAWAPPRRAAAGAAASPYRAYLASGGRDRVLRLWDPVTGSLHCELGGHTQPLVALRYSPDGKRLASGGDDGQVIVWNPARRTQRVMGRVEGSVRTVAWRPDGALLAAGARRGVYIWDVTTGKVGEPLSGSPEGIVSLDWSPNGVLLAAGANDGSVRVWDVAARSLLHTSFNHAQDMTLAWHPREPIVASGSTDGTLVLLDPHSGELCRHPSTGEELRKRAGAIRGLAWSPDGERLAVVNRLGTMMLFDRHLDLRGEFRARPLAKALCWSPDGKTLVTAGEDGQVYVWPLGQPQPAWVALLGLGDSQWLTLSQRGHFTGTSGAARLVHWPSPVQVDRARDRLRRGRRVRVALAGTALAPEPEGDHRQPGARLLAPEPGVPVKGAYVDVRVLAWGDARPSDLELTLDDRPLALPLPQIVCGGTLSAGSAGKDGLRRVLIASRPVGVGARPLFIGSKGLVSWAGPIGARPLIIPAKAGRRAQDGLERILAERPFARVFRVRVPLPPGDRSLSLGVVTFDERGANSDLETVDIQRPTDAAHRGRLFALCVGVSRYRDKRYNLTYADADAKAFTAFLRKQRGLYRGEPYVRQLVDAGAHGDAVRQALADIQNQAQPGDTVIVFLSGHGMERAGRYYFATHEVDHTHPEDTTLTVDDLARFFRPELRARAFLFVDTCHSGSIPYRTTRGEGLKGLQATAFASSRSSEISVEPPRLRHGVFTHALLDACRHAAPGEQYLFFSDLVPHVHRRLRVLQPGQNPVTWGDEAGAPLFARTPTPRPGARRSRR